MPITQIPPYYRAGTASIANGSKNITGTGTSWSTNVEPGDQFFGADGRAGFIDTVNSNTSLTLLDNWPGTTQSALGYTIYRVPDSVRLENYAQRMINLITGGVLTSVGNLDGTGGDKGVMLNGAGSATTFALTAAARALLDDSSPAAMLTTLGALGLAGGTTTGLLNIGVTGQEGSIRPYISGLKTGIFFGTESLAVYGWLYDRATGLLSLRTGATVSAAVAAAAIVTVSSTGAVTFGGAGSFTTLATSGALTVGTTAAVTGALTVGSTITGAAGLMFGRGNILGTVSQTSGVPTGAIIERGSNAQGEYVRFADGTQICTFSITFSGVMITSLLGAIYYGAADIGRTFPAAFVAVPTATSINVTGSNSSVWVGRAGNDTTTNWGFWYPFAEASKTVTLIVKFYAMGRWF